MAWLVHGVARRVPGSRCLDRSLALVMLLRREGIDARLAIGVRRASPDALEAHAWAVLEGEPLGEGGSLQAFAPFDAGGFPGLDAARFDS
jgi:hypothetical protein